MAHEAEIQKGGYLFPWRGRHSHDKGDWRQGWRQSNGQGGRKVSLVVGVMTPC